MTFQPKPRTLYATGVSDPSAGPEWMICLPDGECWDLYENQRLCPLSGGWGWNWDPASTATRIEIARDLTDEEIASLDNPETRPGAVAQILKARYGEAEAEAERWKLAARRMEAEAAEAGALVLSHEGRIERLQRDLEAAQAAQADVASLRARADLFSEAAEARLRECDHYRAIVREALEVARAGEAADERLPEIVRDLDRSLGALEDERDRLRSIIVGLAAKLAGVDG